MKSSQRRRRNYLVFGVFILIAVVIALQPKNAHFLKNLPSRWISRTPKTTRWVRPYGMAPVAFQAFLRACERCRDPRVTPYRNSQTMGDSPLSVGYHKRDGVLKVKRQRIEYSAAVDLAAVDLGRTGINRFLHNLTKQGFACWYREHGKWQGREHIHAVYTSLPMKRQLRRQVKLFLRERRAKGIHTLAWERKWR